MKFRLIKFITIVEILTLICPFGIQPSQARFSKGADDFSCPANPFNGPAFSDQANVCEDSCGNEYEVATKYCKDTTHSNTTIAQTEEDKRNKLFNTLAENKTHGSTQECIDSVMQTRIVGAPCTALCRVNQASQIQMIGIALYATAGAGCIAACAASLGTVGQKICAGVGAAVTVTDIALLGKLMHDGQEAVRKLKNQLKDSITTEIIVGGAGTAAATVVANRFGGRAAACAIGGMLLAQAAIKAAMLKRFSTSRKEACNAINDLQANQPVALIPISSKGGDSAAPLVDQNTGSANGGKTNAAGNSQLAKRLEDLAANFPNGGLESGATEGLLGEIPDIAKMPEQMKEAGIDVSQLMKDVTSGVSPSAAVGSAIPGLPEAVGNALKEFDDASKSPNFMQIETPSGLMSSGGGRSGGSGKSENAFDPFAAFGKKDDPQTAKSAEMTFGAKKGTPSSDLLGTDIWHTDFKGSVSQIVSARIGHNKEKVDQLEWATPLNRALLGLPRLSEKAQRVPAASLSK